MIRCVCSIREKAEELEITQLGLSTKEESETDDIIVGDPFKVLDLEELKKKVMLSLVMYVELDFTL